VRHSPTSIINFPDNRSVHILEVRIIEVQLYLCSGVYAVKCPTFTHKKYITVKGHTLKGIMGRPQLREDFTSGMGLILDAAVSRAIIKALSASQRSLSIHIVKLSLPLACLWRNVLEGNESLQWKHKKNKVSESDLLYKFLFLPDHQLSLRFDKSLSDLEPITNPSWL